MTRPDIQLQDLTVPSGETLRVGSLNLLNQHGNIIGRLERLIAEIQSFELDVLCLQEVLTNAEVDIAAHLAERTQLKFTHAATPKIKSNGDSYGTLTLSRTKFTSKGEEGFHVIFSRGFSIIPATRVATRVNGRAVHIFNAHLTWGSAAEPIRMQQAEIIVAHADALRREDPEAVILLAGDFNAEAESSTVRFLSGLQSSDRGLGTLWVDAWRMWGTSDDRITSDPETHWGAHTGARKSGLFNMALIPKRRLDYLLAYGWVYGKAGSPLSFERFADQLTGDEREISDHFGVFSDIWVPQLTAESKDKSKPVTIKVAPTEVHAARIEAQALRSVGQEPEEAVQLLADVPLPSDGQ